jgi:hypothetical protein
MGNFTTQASQLCNMVTHCLQILSFSLMKKNADKLLLTIQGAQFMIGTIIQVIISVKRNCLTLMNGMKDTEPMLHVALCTAMLALPMCA